MKKLAYSTFGLILAAGAAQAQPTDETQGPDAHAAHAEAAAPAEPVPAPEPAAPAETAEAAGDAAADVAAVPAEPAAPVQAATPAPAAPALAATDVTEVEIDNFAKATVKLQEIQADTALAPEQKQTAMVAAVTEAGLDPAKYNAIGRAAASDATLRAKVQTAMSKYAAPAPTQG